MCGHAARAGQTGAPGFPIIHSGRGVMAAERGWYKLDNAAKIIPFSVEGADTRVMRLTCELTEPVDPELLQQALDETLPEFPYMRCCMRRGIFWYYLDTWREKAVVREEDLPALSALYMPGHKNLLIRVIYFEKRLSVEIFHVLSDGTGGFIFLVHLLTHYLSEKYGLDYSSLAQNISSITQREEDAFSQFYEGRRELKKHNRKPVHRNFIKEMFPRKAYQIHGEYDMDMRQHLLEGTVPTKDLLETARDWKTTIGVLVVSIYVEAMIAQMSVREMRRPIVVSVPVNLRQYFPSATTRNFFGAIQVTYEPSLYNGTLESVIKEIDREFRESLVEDKIFDTMNSYAALEHNYALKMVPLFVKYPALRYFNYSMKKGVSTSVSNVGKVELPEEMKPYVESFCGYMSGRTAFMCLTSYKDNTVFGITSCFTRHEVFMQFFRRLTELGIPVELATNDYDREDG